MRVIEWWSKNAREQIFERDDPDWTYVTIYVWLRIWREIEAAELNGDQEADEVFLKSIVDRVLARAS